ncbi:MAG: S41 family peptidase [Syntrophomonadaceae bacterium]
MRAKGSIYTLGLSTVIILLLLTLPAQASVIDEVRDIIKHQYVDEVDGDILDQPTIEEILTELNDPYSAYMDAEEYREFLNSIGDATITGIGVQIEAVNEGMLVLKVFAGSPADKAGIKSGDIISSVDGSPLSGLSTEQGVALIRGPKDSEINLTIMRGNSTLNFKTKRDDILIPSVEGIMIGDSIGYISIDSFGEETPWNFARVLYDLKDADSYIIDLRNNGGGYVDAVLGIAGHFIGEQTAVKAKTRNRGYDFHAHRWGGIVDKPVVLLVNEYSASASEILTAAAKDYGKALVIGTTTFGKGTIQTLFVAGEGVLKLTTARFFSPRGNAIDQLGVSPDLTIIENDPLDAAALLLGYSEYSPDPDELVTIRIGQEVYTFDRRMAVSPDYWPVFKEIMAALPEYSLYMTGQGNKWQVTSKDEYNFLPILYPGYTRMENLKEVPTNKDFILTFQEAIDKNTVNNRTIELIRIDTGERVNIIFHYLSPSKLVVSPYNPLEAGEYLLVVQPGINLSGSGETPGGFITPITVKEATGDTVLLVA